MHKLGLEPDLNQARSFCDILFPQPFISNLAEAKTGGNRRRGEGRGRGWRRRGGDGYYNKKNSSGYSEAGQSNLNIGKFFPAAGPALVLKGWLGLPNVEGWEIKLKLELEESQVEEVDRPFRDRAVPIYFDFSMFNILNIIF